MCAVVRASQGKRISRVKNEMRRHQKNLGLLPLLAHLTLAIRACPLLCHTSLHICEIVRLMWIKMREWRICTGAPSLQYADCIIHQDDDTHLFIQCIHVSIAGSIANDKIQFNDYCNLSVEWWPQLYRLVRAHFSVLKILLRRPVRISQLIRWRKYKFSSLMPTQMPTNSTDISY